MYLLDTDHIGIIQGKTMPEFGRLWTRMQTNDPRDFFVSIVSFHEQITGWNAYLSRARDSVGVIRAYTMFERILSDFAGSQNRPFDQSAAIIFQSLRGQGVRAATMDLRITSIALANDLVVLTRNLSDFNRIPGVRAES